MLSRLAVRERGHWSAHADTPIPDGCTAVGVALAALKLLKKLPVPLISRITAKKLTTAAQESLLRPDYQEVAVYVARCAVQELKPSTTASTSSGGTSSKYNIFMLLKGIIRTLRDVSDHSQVCSCSTLRGSKCQCSGSLLCTALHATRQRQSTYSASQFVGV